MSAVSERSETSIVIAGNADPDLGIVLLGGESSEGEGDVEIEEESLPIGGNYSSSPSISRHISKRTTITFTQRSILEEFYKCGMTSASMSLNHLHQAAVEKTGLDINVVKNWIRNRRRPGAQRTAEKIASEITPVSTAVALYPSPTPPALVSASTLPTTFTVVRTSGEGPTLHHGVPDPKRMCLDAVSVPPLPHSSSFLVKARVAGSGESDFVEVEVCPLTFHALLRACCEELEVLPMEVLKIRKLPNVWVRKDKDVLRMKEGQELEVVLRQETTSMTSVLTVNPFSSTSNALPILNFQTHTIARHNPDHPTTSLIAALTNEVPAPLTEITGSSTVHINGLQ